MRLTLVTNPDKCNLRCPLCFLNQRGRAFGKGEMPWTVAKAAIDRVKPFEVIPSTMGEPLLYTYFENLLDYCAGQGVALNLTTNGSFPGVWGSEAGMGRLLLACRDIKVSCMGFDETTFNEMMPGIAFERWRGNVERLLSLRRQGTVCLQVTLHRKMLASVADLLRWAEGVNVDRVKWNLPVFLGCGERLREAYGIDEKMIGELREIVRSSKVRSEGSLFIIGKVPKPCNLFENDIWVMPDGTEEHCPNPERRFGDPASAGATCEKCVLF